jgi:hypothetical protein
MSLQGTQRTAPVTRAEVRAIKDAFREQYFDREAAELNMPRKHVLSERAFPRGADAQRRLEAAHDGADNVMTYRLPLSGEDVYAIVIEAQMGDVYQVELFDSRGEELAHGTANWETSGLDWGSRIPFATDK